VREQTTRRKAVRWRDRQMGRQMGRKTGRDSEQKEKEPFLRSSAGLCLLVCGSVIFQNVDAQFQLVALCKR
jgi:hypothetical protein